MRRRSRRRAHRDAPPGRAGLQRDAGAPAAPRREPHADAGGLLARPAHAADPAAAARRERARRKSARQHAGHARRHGRHGRGDARTSRATRPQPSRAADRFRGVASEHRRRHGRRRLAGDHGAGGADRVRMPTGRAQARVRQSDRQCPQVWQGRRMLPWPPRRTRWRSPSTTRVRASPRTNCARVFQPFYASSIAQPRNRRRGLGLAIAKSLIERHQGSLTLSNRTGGGLRARIVLPA